MLNEVLITKYNVDSNAKNAKFKIGDHVRISKYKNIFGRDYTYCS